MNVWITVFFLSISSLFASDHRITYEFSGGRFGDNLLSYLHAKWLSYHYQVPLLYRPFDLSPSLRMHQEEPLFSFAGVHHYARDLAQNLPEKIHDPTPHLFFCPYFPEDPSELAQTPYFSFQVDWKDPAFRVLALKMLEPTKPLQLVSPPKDRLTLALHVRDGGGFDGEDFRKRFPLKLPPLQFYVDALQAVLDRLPVQPIYCHLFTDARNPQVLLSFFQNLPFSHPIEFAFRKTPCHPRLCVLDDFFSLFAFDGLIRSQSNFSIVPSLLKDYAILAYPSSCSIQEGNVRIETLSVEIRPDLLSHFPEKFP